MDSALTREFQTRAQTAKGVCMKRCFILLFLIVASVAHAESSFTFENKRGPYPVGFRAVFQYDESRRYERSVARAPSVVRLM